MNPERYQGPKATYRAVPVTLTEAEAYIGAVHRHNGKPSVVRIAVGAIDESGLLRGVATAGRPVAPGLGRPTTLEVSRVCSDGAPNLCSFLYARIVRAARELGYARLVTYTKEEEDGASLKAAGWVKVPSEQRSRERPRSARDWQAERGEGRTETVSPGLRDRWEIQLADPAVWTWPSGLLPESDPTLFDGWEP
jgi:hypothetical protein